VQQALRGAAARARVLRPASRAATENCLRGLVNSARALTRLGDRECWPAPTYPHHRPRVAHGCSTTRS